MKFESDLGSKNFTSTQPLREFDIPDESGYTPTNSANSYQEEDVAELERQVRLAREAKKLGKERLTDGAKRRLEILLGMTRTTHSVDVNGTAFVFQTLKAKEMREAIMEASQFDGTVQSSFEIRKQFLARSLTSIADVEFGQFIGNNSLGAKLVFIEELDDALLNRLYSEYLKMVDEAKNKYSIKTDDDAQGIVEDLKK